MRNIKQTSLSRCEFLWHPACNYVKPALSHSLKLKIKVKPLTIKEFYKHHSGGKYVKVKVIICGLIFSSISTVSAIPVEKSSPVTVAVEYRTMLNGQKITTAEVSSEFRAHYLMLGCAPVPNFYFGLGIGLDKFQTAKYDSVSFSGANGLSGAGVLSLFSRRLGGVMGFSGGAEVYILNSHQGDYSYTGVIYNPYAGIVLSMEDIAFLEGGLKGQIFDGTMKVSTLKSPKYFSNNNKFHVYLSLTINSAVNSVYLSAAVDASPKLSTDWSNGIDETSFKLQLGFLFKDRKD